MINIKIGPTWLKLRMIHKICKYTLLFVAATGLACYSLSFGMNVEKAGVEKINLLEAINKDNIDAVKEILKDKTFKVNEVLQSEMTPLFWACGLKKREIARLLLEQGADPDIVDNHGRTPLFWACATENHRDIEIIRLLLEHGANPNITDNNTHIMPLEWTCAYRDPEIARLLLEHGADHSIIAQTGDTLLCLAYKYYNAAIVRLLLEYGANPDIADKNGATLRDFAIRSRDQLILQLLDLVENCKQAGNKTQFILDPQRTNEERSFLIKRSLCNSIKENTSICKTNRENSYRKIEETTFGEFYLDKQNFGPRRLANILQINLLENEEYRNNQNNQILQYIKKAAKTNCFFLTLAKILKINLSESENEEYEDGDILKFIEKAAEANHIFLPKDFVRKNDIIERNRVIKLWAEKDRFNTGIVCCNGNEQELFGCCLN